MEFNTVNVRTEIKWNCSLLQKMQGVSERAVDLCLGNGYCIYVVYFQPQACKMRNIVASCLS